MSKTQVFVSGNFNVLHPGHLRLMRFAKTCGDKLLVGVNSDCVAGANAHVAEGLRLEGVQTNSLVDDAFLIETSVIEVIERIQPAVVVKGREYESLYNPELYAVEKYGGRLLFSSGEVEFSSLDLINKAFTETDYGSIKVPQDFMLRHGISGGKLKLYVEKFATLNICVIGDLIVDEYVTCEPLGMSHEDPTIVVTPIDAKKFVGGAGIVAAHAASMGANVNFISICGDDVQKEFAVSEFAKFKVNCYLFDDNRPTTLKQRFRCKGKTLLRVSHLHQEPISIAMQERILNCFEDAAQNANLLVFSDFNYGCLPQALVDKLTQIAKSKGLFIAADSQSSSQIGDIARFKGVNLITPTEREARISTRNREDGLVILAEQLQRQAKAENVLLKLGEEGLLIHASKTSADKWFTDRVGSLNIAPKDVAGAGDSLLIVSAMTLASGGSIWEAACLGSLAAAIQVGRVGNTPIKIKELLKELY
jgi:rfaE bifunctional protein kinase chain/domain